MGERPKCLVKRRISTERVIGPGLANLAGVHGETARASFGRYGRLNSRLAHHTCSCWHQGGQSDPTGRTPATAVVLVVSAPRVTKLVLSYLALENFAVGMIISAVLPPLHTSTVNVRWKSKKLVARGANLDSVTVTEWN